MTIPNRNELHGTATLDHLPEVTLKGNTYQRGVQYGKAVGKDLEKFYYWFVQAEPADVITDEYKRVLQAAQDTAAAHYPLLLEQIRGWADGSGIGSTKCELLAFHNEIRRALRPGCSNIICLNGPDGPWLARNCDLFENERSWQIHQIHQADDCYSHSGTGYLGLPGVQGLNSGGLAIGGSSLPAARSNAPAVFANLTGYLLMMHNTVAGCLEAYARFSNAAQGHMALLDATGDAAAVEAGAGKIHIRRPDASGYLAVTNHSPSGEIPLPPDFLQNSPIYDENSRCRYDRICEMMEDTAAEQRTPDLAWRILSDRNARWPICEKVDKGFHTIHSFVAVPSRKTAEYHWGYPVTTGRSGSIVQY